MTPRERHIRAGLERSIDVRVGRLQAVQHRHYNACARARTDERRYRRLLGRWTRSMDRLEAASTTLPQGSPREHLRARARAAYLAQ